MFDAKSLLDTILGGQTAQQATAAAQSAGSAVAGVVSQAEETLKGTAVGDALSGAKNFAEQNPTAAVAVAGGLAGLGGIAYKAFSNWQQSKPLMEGMPGLNHLMAPAPTGSGFHTDDHSHDTAQLIVRAMAATASADGTIDPGQRATLVAQLQRAGLGSEESAFLDEAVAHPMSPGEIARSVSGISQLAAQVVAAASLVADPANAKEQDFLSRLGAELGMSGDLVTHIKAAVSGLRAS